MAFGKSREDKKFASREEILKCITSEDIFCTYLEVDKLPPKAVSSPFREDKTPSFSVFYSTRHSTYLYKDFSSGEVGNCFILVMRLFSLSNKDACNKIAQDFGLDHLETGESIVRSIIKPRVNTSKLVVRPKKILIDITRRSWAEVDHRYWYLNYGINRTLLSHCEVCPISFYSVNGVMFKADELAYAYIENKDGKRTYKIYQPRNVQGKKWINNNNFSTWELWSQLPKQGENLIITSSRKDAMCLMSFFMREYTQRKDWTACALQSENVLPKPSVVAELKKRFKNIYVLYDNDYSSSINRGRVAGKKICDATGFTQLEIPDEYKSKDISDYVADKKNPSLPHLFKINLGLILNK